MIIQMPNGKVVHLSIEEYLSLSDTDLQDLNGMNIGSYPTSHWHDSSIKKETKVIKEKEITLDYDLDSEEMISSLDISINTLTVDDIETIVNIEDVSEDPD
jgi:hypothetical protein